MDAFSFIDLSVVRVEAEPAVVQAVAVVEDIPIVDADSGSSNPGTYCVIA